MEIPVWVIVLTALLAARDAMSILINWLYGNKLGKAFGVSALFDLALHMPVYAFCWGWL